MPAQFSCGGLADQPQSLTGFLPSLEILVPKLAYQLPDSLRSGRLPGSFLKKPDQAGRISREPLLAEERLVGIGWRGWGCEHRTAHQHQADRHGYQARAHANTSLPSHLHRRERIPVLVGELTLLAGGVLFWQTAAKPTQDQCLCPAHRPFLPTPVPSTAPDAPPSPSRRLPAVPALIPRLVTWCLRHATAVPRTSHLEKPDQLPR